jgi:hypothetical protein
MAMRKAPPYKAGDAIPTTGIYSVSHGEHRGPHQVVLLLNDNFPPCEICSTDVRYRLVQAAPFIFEDNDFKDEPI